MPTNGTKLEKTTKTMLNVFLIFLDLPIIYGVLILAPEDMCLMVGQLVNGLLPIFTMIESILSLNLEEDLLIKLEQHITP